MRLNRLDLTRYGKFTDLSLSFAAPPPGGPDLHVIYGPNEAGKSTLLSGWLDLLFQIPLRSEMNFLHPYTAMQLGAALEIDGRVHELVRIKKRDPSLLDPQGAPLGEALLQTGLRGLDRTSYAAMFSLNRQTLDQGGESILASEGDLGELLFQASAGLTDLSAQLAALREETDDFLNATGRKGRLRELRSQFDDLGEQMKALDTAAADYARLAREREAARDAWQRARAEAEAAQAQKEELQRRIDALPLADRLRRLEVQIAEFGPLPEPPAGWVAELPKLDREETEIATRQETATRAVQRLGQDLRELSADTVILDSVAEIEAAEALKAGHDTALDDLPRRVSERDGTAGAVRDSLARLGQPGAEVAAILPEVAVIGRLRGLIERHSGVETARAAAAAELDRARDDASRAERRLRQAGGAAADLGGLGPLVQRIRRDDPASALDRAQDQQAEAEARLRQALAALAPWAGTTGALTALPRPERATLDRLAPQIDAAERQLERATEALVRLSDELRQAEQRAEPVEAAGLVTLEQAAAVRARREADWARHRAALSAETADLFEQALRLDDQITAALADQKARAQKAAEAALALTQKRQEVSAAEQRQAEARVARDGLRQQLTALVTATSDALPPDMGLDAFRRWLDALDHGVDALHRQEEAARLTDRQQAALDRAQADLRAALALAGQALPPDAGLAPALETAQSLLDRAAQIAALREAAATAREDLERRDKAHAAREAAMAGWQADWVAACAATWMAGAPPDVAAMRAILDELDLLRKHSDRLTDLNRRIEAMQANRDRFATAVQGLARRLGLDADRAAPDLWRDIARRLRDAQETARRRAELTEALAEARDALAAIEAQARRHGDRTAEFAAFFHTTGWEQTRTALTRAGDLARLLRDRQTLIDDLCARLQAATPDQALARLEGADDAALRAQVDSLNTDLQALRTDQEGAHAAYRDAERAVETVGGDDAVARLDEARQTLLLEMEEGARRHLRRRLGLLAVDRALRRYRDTHRSGMLERASDAFRAMSRGRYTGLAAQPDGTREVLVALAADGGSKQAAQLSEGTRAQLYLALRIAGYHEFVRNTGQVPFVADDIMESFDDDRTAEAFGLLAQMSEAGQVIYLTHHAHVCDIARRACPGVTIHQLPA